MHELKHIFAVRLKKLVNLSHMGNVSVLHINFSSLILIINDSKILLKQRRQHTEVGSRLAAILSVSMLFPLVSLLPPYSWGGLPILHGTIYKIFMIG